MRDRIKRLVEWATPGSKEHKQLSKAKRIFEKVYREIKSSPKAEGESVRYSLTGVDENGIEIYETSEEVKKLSFSERKQAYLDIIKNEYSGRTAKFVRNGHTYYAEFDKNSIRKPVYGDKRSSTDGVKALAKVGADGDIFNLIENSQYSRSKSNTKDHTDADYFDYFVKTVQIDGKKYDLIADVEKKYSADGGYIYSLALRDHKKTEASPAHGTPAKGPVKGAGNASTDSIPETSENVNTKYSLSTDDIAPPTRGKRGEWRVTGEDIALAPIGENVQRQWKEVTPETGADERDTSAVKGERDYSISFNGESKKSDSKRIVQIIRDNVSSISPDPKFDVQYSPEAEQFSRKYDYVMKVFGRQGNSATNPTIGKVELVKSGAKSTIAHGYGKVKLAAVEAIKAVIENGNIISHVQNYDNTGIDRYVIAAKGLIDGSPSYIGVVVKSYPNKKTDSKFYLHEAEIIKTDSPHTTAPQLSVDTVGESASVNSIPETSENVKESAENETKKGTPQLIDANSPNVTSEDGFAVTPTDSISKNSENVKRTARK